MHTHEVGTELKTVFDNFENSLRNAFEELCQIAWHYSPAYWRAKYNFYETDDEYYEESGLEDLLTDTCGFISIAISIIDSVTPEDVEVTFENLQDPRLASIILRSISFFGCELGWTASQGDVEIAMRQFSRYKFRDIRGVPSRKLYQCYKNGDRVPLLLMVNDLLEESTFRIKSFDRSKRTLYSNYAPSIWIMSPHGWKLSNPRIETNYHFLTSLLEILEGESGSA